MAEVWGLWNDGRQMRLGVPLSLVMTDSYDSPASGLTVQLPWQGLSPEFAAVQVTEGEWPFLCAHRAEVEKALCGSFDGVLLDVGLRPAERQEGRP